MFLKLGWRHRVYGVLGVLALLSLIPLADVAGWWVLAGIAGAGVLLGLAFVSEFFRALAEVAGAVVVPWLCLLGFNVLLHWFLGERRGPSLELGLVLACLVFAAAATAYLVAWREKRFAAPIVALALAAANLIGVPLLLNSQRDDSAVAARQAVVSQLDVAILVPAATGARDQGGAIERVTTSTRLPDWDVHYSVGRVRGGTVDWLLLDSSDAQAALAAAAGTGVPLRGGPAWRDGADQVTLLDVDGLPPVIQHPRALRSIEAANGEVRRWLRIARTAAPKASIDVLLQTADPRRISAWERKIEPRGGSVASIQRLGARTLTDAALALATDTPSADEDLSLALRFRPVLLFDRGEKLDAPLDIDALLASGRVDLCQDVEITGARCSQIRRASDLISGSTHLRIHRRRAGDRPIASSIYVHPTTVRQGRRKLLFLDYWWYLDANPAAVGAGTSCGVGLAFPGKTCFDHDSDWEGMTVVVDVSRDDPTPIAFQYAEHSDVVRYGFAHLRAFWKVRLESDPRWKTIRDYLALIQYNPERPLAVVARGTHAAYADLCSHCRQVAKKLKENSHNGQRFWPGNDTLDCIQTKCLRLVPTRRGGRDPALWNAYDGVWGDRRCILKGAYCTAEKSPGAPATQNRYKDPTHISGFVDRAGHFHACGKNHPPCPALPKPGPAGAVQPSR